MSHIGQARYARSTTTMAAFQQTRSCYDNHKRKISRQANEAISTYYIRVIEPDTQLLKICQ